MVAPRSTATVQVIAGQDYFRKLAHGGVEVLNVFKCGGDELLSGNRLGVIDEPRQGVRSASRALVAGFEKANVVGSVAFEVAAEVSVEAGHGWPRHVR